MKIAGNSWFVRSVAGIVGVLAVGALAQAPQDIPVVVAKHWDAPPQPERKVWDRLIAHHRGGRGAEAEELAGRHATKIAKCQRLPVMVIDVPHGRKGRDVADELMGSKLFDYVEPDVEIHVDTVPNDPRYGELWAMPKIGAPAAWDLQTRADNVVVAIVDTGIWGQHPDLAANVWINPATGTPGYSYLGGIESSNPTDDHGHGTHVAGTIAAVGNNGLGVVGINWGTKVAAFKFLNSAGSGYISDAVLCYDRILQLRKNGVNIRVVNNSWGGGGYSQAFADALQAATDAGILSVFAGGNNAANTDLNVNYPSCYTNLLVSVLASDSGDNRAGFSNYGYETVDIAAPGVSILSTVPTNGVSLGDASGYRVLNGTSMATPHVVGALAALFQRYPLLTPAQAWAVLTDPGSCDALTTSGSQTSTGGRLNLYKLLTNPYIASPVPNGQPTLTAAIDPLCALPGEAVQVTFAGSDPDGDPLRYAGFRDNTFLPNRLLQNVLQQTLGPTSFVAPHLSRPVWLNYILQVNDRRGGTASTQQGVVIAADEATPMVPPSGHLTVTLADAASLLYRVDFPMTDPDSAATWFQLNIANSSFSAYQNSVYVSFPADWAGHQARFTVLGMDSELNEVRDSTAVNIGTVTNGQTPRADVVFDRLDGEAPLVVHFDATGSSDPDSSFRYAQVVCLPTFAALTPQPSPRVSMAPGNLSGTIAFDQPGSWFVWVLVRDERGNCDSVAAYVYAWMPFGPVAYPQSVTLAEDTAADLTLGGSSTSPGPLTYRVMSGPSHGLLSGTVPNLTYTPAPNYNGSDSFQFTVSDGALASSPATVSLTVTPVNDPPVANPWTTNTPEDTAVGIKLTGSDAEGSALTYRVVGSPAHGVLKGTAPNLTYVPATNYSGSDSFTFVVRDGQIDSLPATVALATAPVNDPPSFALKATSVKVRHGSGPLTVPGWATQISAGPADEAGQVVSFVLTHSAPSLFITQPAINNSGTLTLTPSATLHGSVKVTVTARDDGGTAAGGKDTSAARTFTINIK